MICGATGYAATDSAFVVKGYAWLGGWMVAFVFDQIYIKHVVESVEVTSNWSRAMYTNAWAALFVLGIVALSPEEKVVFANRAMWTPACMLAVGGSCFVAVFISYFGFLARKQLPATAFTVLGNACKIFSVILNVVIWDKHASLVGLVMLALTLTAAILYTPAPLREGFKRPAMQVEADGSTARVASEEAATEKTSLLTAA
jgi:GDP-mannose transporter